MPPLGRDARGALIRAIRVQLAGFRGSVTIEKARSRPWASVTFFGERHRLLLRLQGEDAGAAADAFLAGLDERDFGLRGHILADIALVSDRRDENGDVVRLGLEALTVEAR